MSACPSTGSLFSTPLITLDVPDADRLNGDLRAAIAQREKTHPGTQHSNMGGYQSSWEMDRWGGAPAIRLLGIGRNLANRMSSDREGNVGRGPHPDHFAVTWVCNMWANVNRSGHGNEFHSHPGAFWSAVYYVDDRGISDNPALGGELEFMDPPDDECAASAHGRKRLSGRHGASHPQGRASGDVSVVADASGAPLQGQRRTHLDRVQSRALGALARPLARQWRSCPEPRPPHNRQHRRRSSSAPPTHVLSLVVVRRLLACGQVATASRKERNRAAHARSCENGRP